MVFKNPYGYLIKHFKLIHFILTAIYIYLAIKVSRILNYYNLYIENAASKLDAVNYINNYYIFFIAISIIISVVIYALMRYKKKPRLLYVILIILYCVVGGMIHVSYQGLNTIYFSSIETKTLRLYRDLLNIMVFVQYISIAFVLVRAMGFDIKKFNFVQDLNDLHLDEKDTEEIEVALGGTESIQRRINRSIREFRYYYIENKAFIIITIFIVLVFLIGGTFFHREVINKEYKEGEVVSTDDYRFSVLNTYVTNKNYLGQAITDTDSMFVVVKMNIGTNHQKMAFKMSNLILKVNHHSYSVNNRYSKNFTDLGVGYSGSKISGMSTYLFIYVIDLHEKNNKMSLEYAGDKVIKLNPTDLDSVHDRKEYKLNEQIDFNGSTLGNGSFIISNYKIAKSFNYSYQYEVMGKQNTGNLTISGNDKYILHLEMKGNIPYFDNYDFINTLSKLKYKFQDKEYIVSFSNKTPGSYKDGLYLMIDSNMENADSIWFEFQIRNIIYIYKLK